MAVLKAFGRRPRRTSRTARSSRSRSRCTAAAPSPARPRPPRASARGTPQSTRCLFAVCSHYMIQPSVELYGGCMVVLKVS